MKIAHRRLPDDDTGRWAGLKLLEVVAELTLGITVFVSKGEPHIKYWSVVVPSLRPSLNLALVVVLARDGGRSSGWLWPLFASLLVLLL